MEINTTEDIARLLLLKKIQGTVSVTYNQDKMPAFMACYHTETKDLI